jgi:Chlorophyll A-B binding protein
LLVSAFTNVGRVSRSTFLKMSFEEALGAQAPLGFWDPLGLLKEADQERFDRLRYVENKHGRISMLAVLGHLVTTAGIHLPGDIAFGTPFASVDNGLAGLFGEHAVPQQGLTQLIIFIGAVDLGFTNYAQPEVEAACLAKMEEVGWDEQKQSTKAAIELNNGRAAQMGILALMVHEKLNNDPYIINSLLGAPVPFNLH